MLLFFPKAIYPEINGYRIRAAATARMLSKRYSCKALLVVPPNEDGEESRLFLESLGIPTHYIQLNRFTMPFYALGGALFSGLPLQVAAYMDMRVKRYLKQLLPGEMVFVSMIRAGGWLRWYPTSTYQLDLIDLIGLGYAEALTTMRWSPMKVYYTLERARLQSFENRIAAAAANVYLVTEHQCAQLNRLLKTNNINFLPNGVTTKLSPPREKTAYQNWYFLGPLLYHPNQEAMAWFLEEIWPRLRQSVNFKFIGKGGSASFRQRMRESGMEVYDFVPDLDEVLADYPVCIAPMRSGAGLQNKVLEAMHSGRLVLLSERCATGFPGFVSGQHGYVVDSVESWLHVVDVLAADPHRITTLSAAAQKLVHAYQWDTIAATLYASIDASLDQQPIEIENKQSWM